MAFYKLLPQSWQLNLTTVTLFLTCLDIPYMDLFFSLLSELESIFSTRYSQIGDLYLLLTHYIEYIELTGEVTLIVPCRHCLRWVQSWMWMMDPSCFSSTQVVAIFAAEKFFDKILKLSNTIAILSCLSEGLPCARFPASSSSFLSYRG